MLRPPRRPALVAVLLLAGAGCERPATPPPPVTAAPAHTNRLAAEKSPYLLQHRHNPVDWHPWGEAAFARARAEQKPIFLSIGYSTCHWCHVMERESFEDEATARVLNEHFISIKVDREERPDVDQIYMTYVQARTGSGGWPLNVFLTPELQPFYGGTYWPPQPRHGRPSFVEVLQQIAEIWRDRRHEVLAAAEEMTGRLREHAARTAAGAAADADARALAHALTALKEGFDAVHGGWGGAPKFPSPSHPSFLLRAGYVAGDAEAVRQVLLTCDRMAAGGLYDQLGGGFARYSVDAEWLVPHFEKMLYDNAQLVQLYLDAFLATGDARHAEVVRSTLAYVLRDMTHPGGGFYSAEDADSEGHEGKFYCWTKAELKALLTPVEFAVAARHFGITARGNFVDHSHPSPLPGQNVLHLADRELSAVEAGALARAKEKMWAARQQRVRPHLDDKVLASWNGLMLGALARAAVVLDEPAWLAAAEKNLAFLQEKLWVAGAPGTLHHRWRDGERDAVQLLDAYAYLLDGTLHLYEATLQPAHLGFAVALAEAMLARFHDAEHGGFWQTPPAQADLLFRVKEINDGAQPSGNGVAALALLRLAAITERQDFRAAAEGVLRAFGGPLENVPQAVPYLLQALDFSLEEPRRVVIAGDLATAEARALVRAAHGVLQPGRVVLGTVGPVEPFARTLSPRDGRATAYVCTGNACQPPTHDAAQLMAALRAR